MNRPFARAKDARAKDEGKRELWVEGQEDYYVVRHLFESSFLGDKTRLPFKIKDKKGIQQVFDDFSAEARGRYFNTYGIVIDADQSPEDRWNSARRLMQELGANVPKVLDPQGVILERQKTNRVRHPRLGVWIMPDNRSSGEVEDFFSSMLTDDPVWPECGRFVEAIRKRWVLTSTPSSRDGNRLFKQNKSGKAKVRVWRAIQRDPLRMGAMIKRGMVTHTNPLSQTFLQWLCNLFEVRLGSVARGSDVRVPGMP